MSYKEGKPSKRQSVIASILEESDGGEEDASFPDMSNPNMEQHRKKPQKYDKSQPVSPMSKMGANNVSGSISQIVASHSKNKGRPFNPNDDNISRPSNLNISNLTGSAMGIAIEPETMFQGNLVPQSYYSKSRNRETMTQRHSNISNLRKT